MTSVIQWLKGERFCTFSSELAASLKRDLPPALVPNGEAISASRVAKILERAYGKAQAFADTHQPGFVRRAQMANEFRWKLSELGYDKEFISIATEGFVVYLSRRRGASEASK